MLPEDETGERQTKVNATRATRRRRQFGASKRVYWFEDGRKAAAFASGAQVSPGRYRGYRLRFGRFVEVGDLYEAEVAEVEAEAAAHGGGVLYEGSFQDAAGGSVVNDSRMIAAELETRLANDELG